MAKKKPSPFDALKPLQDKLRTEAEEKARAEAEKRRAALEAGRRPPPRAPDPRPAPRRSAVEVWRPDLDKDLFRAAMEGVRPLSQAPTRLSARDPSAPPPKPSAETRMRRAHAEGAPTLAVRWAEDGTVTGVRPGRSFALEALGRFAAPQETLDLHGYEPPEAATRVAEFVRSRRARGLRCVCVVHGWGKNAPDGASVLRDAVVQCLANVPACGEIDAFATAPEDLGGRGALLISLRS